MAGDGLSDEERKWAYEEQFGDFYGKPSSGGRSGSGSGAEFLIMAGLWAFAWIATSYFLAAPAIVASLFLWHAGIAEGHAEIWVLLAGSPIVALLVAWRTDKWRRPIAWRRILTLAVLLQGICFATALAVEFYNTSSVSSLDDPRQMWAAISALATFTVWPTCLVFSIAARMIRRKIIMAR